MKKLKYFKMHKIPNVDINVCCAEQVIAYKMLSYLDILTNEKTKKTYNSQPEFAKKDFVFSICNELKNFFNTYHNKEKALKKYDFDFVFALIRQNADNYINAKYHILSTYNQVGELISLSTWQN